MLFRQIILAGLVYCLSLPLLAERASVPPDGIWEEEVPAGVAPMLPKKTLSQAFFRIPGSPLAILTVRVGLEGSEISLLRLDENGAFARLSRRACKLDWSAERNLELLLLGETPETGFMVAKEGSTLGILAYLPKEDSPLKEFTFWAGSGASPWSVPTYSLRHKNGRIVICDSTDSMGEELPDGSHSTEFSLGEAVYFWNGRVFEPVNRQE